MKVLKKVFFFLFGLLLLIAAGLALAAYYYGDDIKALVVKNLNKNLKTEVKVSGIDFSFFEHFPQASVVFHDALIYAVDAKNDTLLSAKKLSVELNLIDLYKGNYNLTGLTASDGFCEMIVDNSGRANYIFWNQNDTSSSQIAINLEKVVFANMQYTYIDYSKNIGISFLVESAGLTGNFKEQVFDLGLKTKLENAHIQIGEMNLFEDRTLYILAKGNVNQATESINFYESNIGVDDMNIAISGAINYGESSALNLVLKSNNADLKKAIALLPKNIQSTLKRFTINGEAKIAGTISGAISSSISPHYAFNFSVKEGEFIDKKNGVSFTNTSLKGSVTNGTKRKLSSTKLILENFQTLLNQSKIDGKLSIINFTKPTYKYAGNVAFKLKDAVALLEDSNLLNSEGNVEANLDVKGILEEVGKYSLKDWKSSKIEGKIKLNNLGFQLKNRPQIIKKINGELTFNNNSINISSLKGNVNNSSVSVNGKFNNLIGYLLEKEEPLFIDATLFSPKFNLNDLLISSETTQQQEKYELDISPKITVYLNLKVDELLFNRFQLADLSGDLIVKNERIDARGISFNSQEGKFDGDLFIREKAEQLNIIAKADLTEISINKLFNSFNNFGQSSLKAENIYGTANATVNYNSMWSKQLEIDPASIKVDADFIINNGRLVNFKPLESLSRFVELEELKEVRFKQLQNQILIENEIITIPRFDIFSSALNLSIEGTHTFKNDIDYHITLLLSEILGKKVKKPASTEFGYVEDDGLNKKSKLYLKMSGNVENPKISYDTEELKVNLKKKFTEEKNTFKKLMKDEFGLFKNDTNLNTKPNVVNEKKSPFQIEIDSSFIKEKLPDNEVDKKNKVNEGEKKSKFGKFLDKIAKPNEEEFVAPIEN